MADIVAESLQGALKQRRAAPEMPQRTEVLKVAPTGMGRLEGIKNGNSQGNVPSALRLPPAKRTISPPGAPPVDSGHPIKDSKGIIGFGVGGSKAWQEHDNCTFSGSEVPFGGRARVIGCGDPSSAGNYGQPAENAGGTGLGPNGEHLWFGLPITP